MQCFYHTDIEAVGICAICGKAVCQACAVDVAGGLRCQQCLSSGAISKRSSVSSYPTNPLAVVSLVLSVLGIAGCCCSPIIAMLFGIPAAITGYSARKQILAAESQQGIQLATIGMALGIGETAIGLLVLLFVGSAFGVSLIGDLLQNLSR